jgi:hypothetical protein
MRERTRRRARPSPPLRRSTWVVLGACCLLLATVALASAQGDGGYDLSWWTVDGGGATFNHGGGYTLGGTAGQPEPGLLTGGDYALGGGFWGGGAAAAVKYELYLPLVMRNF